MLHTELQPVDVACSIEETASGAVHLHMKPCAGNRASNVREGSIVVLTLGRPPPRGTLEWVQGARGRGHHGAKGLPGPAAKKARFCNTLCGLSLMVAVGGCGYGAYLSKEADMTCS